MASVTLDELWVHDASNLGIYVALIHGSLVQRNNRDGGVRVYAGGRVRMVTRPTTTRAFRVDAAYVDRADVDVLRTWVGSPVMVRDPLGRKAFGTYLELEETEQPIGPGLVFHIAFDLLEITHTEAV